MKTNLQVIVHEYAVRTEALIGNLHAQKIYEEIATMRRKINGRVIEIHGLPSMLDQNMPPPSDKLKVQVSGAYTYACVASQVLSLKRAGYDVEFHPSACLEGKSQLPQTIKNYILQEFPDFFDSV